MLCGHPSDVYGAEPCPREAGHAGEHYWSLPWEEGSCWRVIVYSGAPYDRRRRCAGVFTAEPRAADIARLLRTIAPLRRAEVARRTPVSEPALVSTPLYPKPDMRGMVLVRG